METPSSTRRVTRSQTLAASNGNNIPVSRKTEDSEKTMSKSRQRSAQQQQDRSALIDITNDSPIVGLANGGNLETPLAKQRGSSRVKKTPGSGEALLRGQVKTLLQKVEEEAVLSKLSLESRPFLRLMSSPMGLLAPTPANTPQIPNLSGSSANSTTGLESVNPSPIVQEQLISQVVNHIFDGKNEENSESEKSVITRSLLLDFSEKSEVSDASEECCSELSYQEVAQGGGGGMEKATTEDDDASIWSIQVNASTHDEEEEAAEDEEDYYEDAEKEEEEEEEEEDEGGYDDGDGGLLLDELCEGMNNISMNEIGVGAKFAGKHTRFVYNSDDELIKEEEEDNGASSPNVLRLKGLPTPKGKHLRFSGEEEEEGH